MDFDAMALAKTSPGAPDKALDAAASLADIQTFGRSILRSQTCRSAFQQNRKTQKPRKTEASKVLEEWSG
ncbi:hypothetical protein CO661_10020 [Sinorhizobium fredii]|uniref:Uncharacterized protein n=1 Tax=Rhizobium fredii TaxID=380 RepID=A0A2A6M003_RHIFR|nr:hypothetical protein AOX55_00003614 [Sinorhizobium fredii CCBAU 25509]PDT48193.1 hypothetical protein CO661_10020 [Sinorhizobium fredii]